MGEIRSRRQSRVNAANQHLYLNLYRQESPDRSEVWQGRIWIPQDVWNNGYPDVGTPEKVIMKKESKFHPERHFWIRCTNGAEYHWKTVRDQAGPGSENFDASTGEMWIQPSVGIDSDGGSKKKRTRKRKKRKRRKKKRTKKHRK